MLLSDAQSALVGIFFTKIAGSAATIAITPYAASYFLVLAVWLTVGDARSPGCWLKVKLALV